MKYFLNLNSIHFILKIKKKTINSCQFEYQQNIDQHGMERDFASLLDCAEIWKRNLMEWIATQ